VEAAFPVAWHLARRTRHRLIERMVLWRRQPRTLQHVISFIVVKPILTRLKGADYGVAASAGVCRSVLAWR